MVAFCAMSLKEWWSTARICELLSDGGGRGVYLELGSPSACMPTAATGTVNLPPELQRILNTIKDLDERSEGMGPAAIPAAVHVSAVLHAVWCGVVRVPWYALCGVWCLHCTGTAPACMAVSQPDCCPPSRDVQIWARRSRRTWKLRCS